MHGERFFREFSRIMELGDHGGRARELAVFLESLGYLRSKSSAENVTLICSYFSLESLYHIVAGSLLTPVPDMALNAFERLAGVIPPEDLAEVAQRRKRLGQFIQLCGSSPFLVNLIYKVPAAFRWLFLENAVDLARRGGEMLAALRSQV
ncbi:MAG: bifunctional [glutamate--ammonia ligase]-adenylyl-L-tyrosine phosphorylase/[glutamate--ammonia-ligase] adenylyltransferase, partial [Oryzomonas sp.]